MMVDDDEKMAAARASVSRPSEVTVVGVALFLPLEKGDGTGEANSPEDNASDVVGVLQQQFHTSPHWQGFSRDATVEKTGDIDEDPRRRMRHTLLAWVSCSNRRQVRRVKGVFEAIGEGWDDGDIAFLWHRWVMSDK